MEKLNSQISHFFFKSNIFVESVEREYIKYDCDNDTDIFKVSVVYRDGQKYSWLSNVVSRYGNGLFVDLKGIYLFGCSLKGIYCCDLKTGKKIWQKKKMAYFIVMNDDDTLTCEWLQRISILDINGNTIKELKTNYESSVFYIGDNKFLIRTNKSNWSIVTSHLDVHYTIPNQLILSRIRSAKIINDTLNIKYWSKNNIESNINDEQIISLHTYKVK